ncbi:hypothetical protein WX45_00173 [Clostridium ljungdahlii DSM 13528]|uniref:YetF C-terminal domain-containing protein n=3 Tax=Clostridium TaxID=1485 RepID=A0ABX2TSD0_CLOLD|nr:DUF421 domain-containing protein [Clostridium autoethanogenum]AGY78018.1 DUF421 domain-containing protein [Clostridium autoethanogenum DSM 10061]ALU38152.1 putative membrane protein [Clostridium autoethanogenum DSM 10061]OAA85968.1 hypothetical protein WX45_00173 [Clostridium ljungdahlii DSM 13528]OVY50916.1 hypothetical protein WX72_02077 [Clostridium autoethanogenum]
MNKPDILGKYKIDIIFFIDYISSLLLYRVSVKEVPPMTLGIINVFQLLLKTTVTFIVLLTLARILGNKQMSHLTFFNYITGITIGSIAANIISIGNKPFINDLIGLTWWCILTALTGYINLKSGNIRSIIDGQPTILIKRGEIMKQSLSSSRLNMDDLSMLLRKQNIFSITEVEYAILEPDGNLSVMKKQSQQQVTKSDMKIPYSTSKYIPSEIIVDGKIINHNLEELNLNKNWLKKQLKQQNIASIEDVFYAEIQSDGTLFIDKN